MKLTSERLAFALVLPLVLVALTPSRAAAQDTLTVGTASGLRGATVSVPVYVRDGSGTLLGSDAGAGNRIQSFALRLTYATALGTANGVARAGVCGPLTAISESSVPATGAIGYVVSYNETTNAVPLALNAGLPGDQVATVSFTISGSIPNGTYPLTVDTNPVTTGLANQAGTQEETTATAAPSTLSVVSGAITVTPVELLRLAIE